MKEPILLGFSFLKDQPLSKNRADKQLSLWIKKTQIALFSGVAITIILLLFYIYLAGIISILAVTVVMSMLIMQDSVSLPYLDLNFQMMPNRSY